MTVVRQPRKRRLMGAAPTHLNVRLTAAEYDALYVAAGKRGVTLTRYAVEALKARMMADESYFYLRLADGQFYPPLTEPGFEDVNNAKRAAMRRNADGLEADVVRHMMEIVP